MIQLEEAQRLIAENSPLLPTEMVSLESCLGRVLGQNISAREPIPFFDNSAMDGYAVKVDDVAWASDSSPVRLTLQGMIQAGDLPDLKLRQGHAIRIFTGAPVPDGCEAVVMQEYVDKDGDTILVKRSAKSNENIRRIGDEFSVGDRVFETGMRITPPVMGMLATLGYAELDVYRQPKVSVIVTGNELMPLTTVLQPGQIHESNSYALNAALNAMGVTPHKVVRVIDDKQELKDAFGALIDESDVVISVGGISVGDFDFVKDVVDELDVETIFYKIAMKPGKPNYFGRKGDTLIFGLPGNPVSVMVSFYMYPRVAINRMSGLTDDRTIKLSARLQEDLKKKVGRISLIRGVVGRDESGDLVVSPTIGQGSHKMSGLAHANCFIHFPKDKRFISKDSQVEVELIHWSNL